MARIFRFYMDDCDKEKLFTQLSSLGVMTLDDKKEETSKISDIKFIYVKGKKNSITDDRLIEFEDTLIDHDSKTIHFGYIRSRDRYYNTFSISRSDEDLTRIYLKAVSMIKELLMEEYVALGSKKVYLSRSLKDLKDNGYQMM